MEQIVINDFEKKYNKQGYTLIKINNKFILEHKYIVESFLNRKLTKDEVIHHINSCKTDNSIENLMLFNNQNEHKSFENKVKQFGWTNPIKRIVKERWNKVYLNSELFNLS